MESFFLVPAAVIAYTQNQDHHNKEKNDKCYMKMR